MKQVSKLTLAAMLSLGAGGLTLATPALAKDKKVEAPKASYTPAFVKAAQPAQNALKTDPLAADPLVTAAEAAATSDDDKYAAGLMRIQVEQARMKTPGADQQKLRGPLEALVNNPKTTTEQRGQFAFVLAQLALQRKDNATAAKYLAQAQQAGYSNPDLPVLLAQTRMASGDVTNGTADLEAAIKAKEAAGQPVPEDWYRFAWNQAYKAKNKPQTLMWVKRWVTAYPTSEHWHDTLTLYALQPNSLTTLDKSTLVDLFRLMRHTRSLDSYGYVEYAQKTIDSGLPAEAKAVLTEGKANGKVANTANNNALLQQATGQAQLEGSLASLEARAQAGPDGKLAAQTAEVYLGQGNYAKAASLYRTALTKGGVDASTTNMRLGIALAMGGDKEGARTAFQAVTGPRADLAQFWIISLDHPATA